MRMKAKMNQLEQEAKEASGEMEDLAEATKDAEEGFTVMKGAMGTFLGNAMTKIVDMAKEGVTSIYNLADETREYRGEMNNCHQRQPVMVTLLNMPSRNIWTCILCWQMKQLPIRL